MGSRGIDGVKMVTRSVVFVSTALLMLICSLIVVVRSGTYAAQERALKKRAKKDTTTDNHYHVVLKPWHSHLVESGYMGSTLVLHLRPGDVIHAVTDDDDKPDKFKLDPPFRAIEKGTLLIHIDDLEAGKVSCEWRRLRA